MSYKLSYMGQPPVIVKEKGDQVRDTKGRYSRKVLVKDERVLHWKVNRKTGYALLIVAGLFCLYQLVWEFHPPQAHAEEYVPMVLNPDDVHTLEASCAYSSLYPEHVVNLKELQASCKANRISY